MYKGPYSGEVNMKTKRKPKSKLHLLSIIWGLIFTAFMLLIVGSKIIIAIVEGDSQMFNEFPGSFATWDDPAPYFFTYMIGYVLIWWKPLWGSIIIILGSIFYVIIAGFDGPPIFAAPGLLVGLLYQANWIISRRNQIKN